MAYSPVFAAGWYRTLEERIATDFSAATKTDPPKILAEADISMIALVSHPEHIDL